MSDMPKIKIWDIETSHNLLLAYSLLNRNMISYKQILQERYIISAAFKDYGEKTPTRGYGIHEYTLWDKDVHDDYAVVAAIHEELSDCDAVVAHYGDKFDLPFFNTRAIYHGFDPIPDLIQVDTYKIAKNKFKFNSNRLDYIAKYLNIGGKIPTNLNLWLEVFAGDIKAARAMLKYNIQDVDLLEKVYEKLKIYVPAKINHTLWTGDEVACPHCGSTHINYRGTYKTRRGVFPKFQCQSCGGWGSHAAKDKSVKSKVK